MRSGKLLLQWAIITGCAGLFAGCSTTSTSPSESVAPKASAPAREAQSTSALRTEAADVAAKTRAKLDESKEQAVPQAQALQQQTKAKVSTQARRAAAEKQRLAQLRERRHREWEAKQQEVRQRAAYQRRLQEQQSQVARREAAAQQQQRAQQQQAQARQQQQRQQQQLAMQQRRQAQAKPTSSKLGYGGKGVGNYHATRLTGDFAGNAQVEAFITKMVREKGFKREYLYGVLSQTRNRDDVARLWNRVSGGSSSPGGWNNYRSKFVTPDNVKRGVKFWNQYGVHLQRASQRFGVDPEYIVGIIGVETRWGRILGKHRVIDALLTSAVVNKRRSKFFFSELENYLLMTQSEKMDPLEPKGSYAGAMGYGQFMPSSFRAYAVDFDGDGIRDLWNPVDAIGSVANYFAEHGWRNGQEVAVPAAVSSSQYASMPDGYKVRYSANTLSKKGIKPRDGDWSYTGRTHLLALTTVPGGRKEPWIGYHNFYVITRYNHSNYYAMAVHQLAQSVKMNTGGGLYASR